MVSFRIGERHEYLYYEPLSDTDWYLCTSMTYDTVHSQVSNLSRFMVTIAAAVRSFIVLIILVFYVLHRENEKRQGTVFAGKGTGRGCKPCQG